MIEVGNYADSRHYVHSRRVEALRGGLIWKNPVLTQDYQRMRVAGNGLIMDGEILDEVFVEAEAVHQLVSGAWCSSLTANVLNGTEMSMDVVHVQWSKL